MSTESPLVIQVGEHYLYCEEPYQVVDIAMDTVQLRSLSRYSHIAFKSLERLHSAWQHGNLRRISDAPLAGAQNRIIDSLSEKDRAQLERRLAYVKPVQAEFLGRLPVEQTKQLIQEVGLRIGDPQPPSYETLYQWNRNFKISGGSITSLIPKPKKHQKRINLQPEEVRTIIVKILQDQYFTRPHASQTDVIDAIRSHLKMLNCQRTEHLKIPSNTTLWRIIIEFDTYETELHQRGFKHASRLQKWSKKARRPKYLLERIECDTHLIDLELVDADGNNIGRAFLTVALEVASRCIVGYDISLNYPSIEKTIRAIKMSLSDRHTYNGLGKSYIVDNGADYAGTKLADCLHLLGARVVFCEPYSPDQKPHVERWFKTFALQLPHIMKGTTYSNIAERGDYNSKKQAIYTLERVQGLFSTWLDKIYHHTPHSSLDHLSPTVCWDEHVDNLFPPHRYSDDDLHQLFLSKTTAVATNGRVRHNNLQWTCPAVPFLATQNRKKNELIVYYDISELGYAWICHPGHPDDIYPAEAVDPEYQNGLTMHMHDLIRKRLRDRSLTFDFSSAKEERLRLIANLTSATKQKEKNRRKVGKNKKSIAPNNDSCVNPSTATALEMPAGMDQVIPQPFEVIELKPTTNKHPHR